MLQLKINFVHKIKERKTMHNLYKTTTTLELEVEEMRGEVHEGCPCI